MTFLSHLIAPGNSVREVGDSIKGGAVIADRSPVKPASLRSKRIRGVIYEEGYMITHDFRKEVQLLFCAAGTAWIYHRPQDTSRTCNIQHFERFRKDLE